MEKILAYFERNPELRVLFVFNEPFLEEELERAQWPSGYRYVRFNPAESGGWFTIKYRLDTEWVDDRVILYFDQSSPLEQRSLRESFPLLDVLVANMEYRHQDYAAFMQQYNLPSAMTRFVESNIAQLQSATMLRLLQPYYNDGTISEDVAVRAFLSTYLGVQRILPWTDIIIRIILLGRDSERSKQKDFYIKLQGNRSAATALERKLRSIFSASYEENSTEKIKMVVKTMKYNAIVQKLATVADDNYQSLRITDSVALQEMNSLLEQALSQPRTAAPLMEVMEQLGSEIRTDDIIRWYGTDANYHFMPTELCLPILRRLLDDVVEEEPNRVIDRVEELLMKHGDDPELCMAMDYSLRLARYYDHVGGLGTFTLNAPADYVENYRTSYYAIDQYYRLATEAYYKISPSSPLFETAQAAKLRHEVHYAKLINRLNIEWTRCVSEAGGFGSLSLLRQSDFYDECIRPLQKKVAIIVSDALRYELAQELIGKLAETKHMAELRMALAMLPTETKYCKLALLPHRELKLYGTDGNQAMSVDDKLLTDTEKRSAHVDGYRSGAICIQYEEVAQYNQSKNREIFKHPVVYVFHDDIDEAGHGASGKQVVEGCRQAIEDLATLVRKIHATYNVSEVIVTADHGFLFNDMEFAERDRLPVVEDTLERKSRYYLTTSDARLRDIVKFPLSEVSAIQNANDMFVAMPMGTNRMLAPAGGYMFAHGGASLQEMLIPVIVSRLEREDTKPMVGVTLLSRGLSVQSSRLRFYLLQTEAVSMDTKERTITVALYDGNQPVSPRKVITLDKSDPSLDNRKVLVDLTLNRSVNSRVLQLKVYDSRDDMNPLVKENVTNNTLIENDFD